MKSISSIPDKFKFKKSCELSLFTSTVIFPAPVTELLPKISSLKVNVTVLSTLIFESPKIPVKVESAVNCIVSLLGVFKFKILE